MVRFLDQSPDTKDYNGEVTQSSTYNVNKDEQVNGIRNAVFVDGEGHKRRENLRTEGQRMVNASRL
jgi:hypothetical protein